MTPTVSGKGNAALTARFLHKTRLCLYYASGHCDRGEDCGFAHGSEHLRAAPDFSYTQQCRSFTKTGTCRQGDACKFAHARGQLKPWKCTRGGAAERGGKQQRGALPRDPREAPWAPDGLPPAAAFPTPRPPDVPAPRAVQFERQQQRQRPQHQAPWAPDGRPVAALPLKDVRSEWQQQPQHQEVPWGPDGRPVDAFVAPRPREASAPKGEWQQQQVPWAPNGRLVDAVVAPCLRDMLAPRGQEPFSQLKAVVKCTFLHFFVPGEDGTVSYRRRCSSAPPVIRTDQYLTMGGTKPPSA